MMLCTQFLAPVSTNWNTGSLVVRSGLVSAGGPGGARARKKDRQVRQCKCLSSIFLWVIQGALRGNRTIGEGIIYFDFLFCLGCDYVRIFFGTY